MTVLVGVLHGIVPGVAIIARTEKIGCAVRVAHVEAAIDRRQRRHAFPAQQARRVASAAADGFVSERPAFDGVSCSVATGDDGAEIRRDLRRGGALVAEASPRAHVGAVLAQARVFVVRDFVRHEGPPLPIVETGPVGPVHLNRWRPAGYRARLPWH